MKVSLVDPEEVTPIQSIFRTFNPDKLNYERVKEELYGFGENEIEIQEGESINRMHMTRQ